MIYKQCTCLMNNIDDWNKKTKNKIALCDGFHVLIYYLIVWLLGLYSIFISDNFTFCDNIVFFFFTYLGQNQCDHKWHCIQKKVDIGKHFWFVVFYRSYILCTLFLRIVLLCWALFYWPLFLGLVSPHTTYMYNEC